MCVGWYGDSTLARTLGHQPNDPIGWKNARRQNLPLVKQSNPEKDWESIEAGEFGEGQQQRQPQLAQAIRIFSLVF